MSGEDKIKHLKKRLGVHRRRLRYWSGNPSFTNFGPVGEQLRRRDEFYELARDDAQSIAQQLSELGVNIHVVDVKRTFQCRFNKPDAPEILIWPVAAINREEGEV